MNLRKYIPRGGQVLDRVAQAKLRNSVDMARRRGMVRSNADRIIEFLFNHLDGVNEVAFHWEFEQWMKAIHLETSVNQDVIERAYWVLRVGEEFERKQASRTSPTAFGEDKYGRLIFHQVRGC